MLLTDFFSSTEGESYVTNHKTTKDDISRPKKAKQYQSEGKKGHLVMAGPNKKGSKTVPDCAPNNESKINEDSYPGSDNNQSNEDFINYNNQDEVDNRGFVPDLLQAKGLITQALLNPEMRGEYFDFLKSIRRSHSKEYSTMIHQKAVNMTKQHKV